MTKVRKLEQRLIRFRKAPKKLIDDWSEGATFVADFGLSIEQLRFKATAERWKISLVHRKEGEILWSLATPPYRAIVSRYYYVMYHAMRAVCYLYHSGDDFEAHSKLHQNIPDDFPDSALWRNNLKNARLTRNAADYDPYPKSQTIWAVEAQNVKIAADTLIKEVRIYLRSKGCPQV